MTRWIGPVISAGATGLFVYLATYFGGWGAFWFGLLAVGGIAETIALAQRGKRDTFTENVQEATESKWPRIALAAFMSWLSWHLVFDRKNRSDEGK